MIFERIKKRQELAEQGKAPPVMIFPEGCTTNEKYLIKFKKGAFASLRPVKPYINTTKALRLK